MNNPFIPNKKESALFKRGENIAVKNGGVITKLTHVGDNVYLSCELSQDYTIVERERKSIVLHTDTMRELNKNGVATQKLPTNVAPNGETLKVWRDSQGNLQYEIQTNFDGYYLR